MGPLTSLFCQKLYFFSISFSPLLQPFKYTQKKRKTDYRENKKELKISSFIRRSSRDSNSGASFPTYTLSKGASSATWVLLQVICINVNKKIANSQHLLASFSFVILLIISSLTEKHMIIAITALFSYRKVEMLNFAESLTCRRIFLMI